MMQRPAAMAGFLSLVVALALSGCLSGDAGSPFGPGSSDDGGTATGVNEAGNGLALVFKASPAAGEAPLEVDVTVRAADAPAKVPWSIDFGDGSRAVTGTGLPAEASHTYREAGVFTVTASVGEGVTASKAVLSLLVRPESEDEPETSSTSESTTTQPPFQPPPPPPPPPSSTSSSSSTTSDSSTSSTTAPPTNSSTSSTTTTSETTTSTSETSSTTSETTTSTSETTTTTSETTTTSDTGTTTSESQTQTTTSESSTTTEPQA